MQNTTVMFSKRARAKHTGVIKVEIHGDVSYVANCFNLSYNGMKFQNGVKFSIKYFPKSPLAKYMLSNSHHDLNIWRWNISKRMVTCLAMIIVYIS